MMSETEIKILAAADATDRLREAFPEMGLLEFRHKAVELLKIMGFDGNIAMQGVRDACADM